jgi:hypothetical protein
VLVLAALVAVVLLTLEPLEPLPADAPAEEFSAERALPHVERIAERPHPVGSAYADTRSHTVTAATVDGISVEETPGHKQTDTSPKWRFVFHAVPPEGIDVTLEVRGESQLPLRVVSYRDGLPQVPELVPRPDDLTWSGTSSNLTMITETYHV